MQTCTWFLALHCVLWWTTVDSAIYVYEGPIFDQYESRSSKFDNSTEPHDYRCTVHYDLDFCAAPPAVSSLQQQGFNSDCIAVLIWESSSDGDCDLGERVESADDWLNDSSAVVDDNSIPIIIIAGGSYGGIVDDYNPDESELDDTVPHAVELELNDTSSFVVTTSLRTGVVLVQRQAYYVVITDEPPLDDPWWEDWQDDPWWDDWDSESETQPPLPPLPPYPNDVTDEGGSRSIPTGALTFIIFIALIVLFLCCLNCCLWSVGLHFLGGGAAPRPPPVASEAVTTKKVLTESQVNQLVNSNLDKEHGDASKEELSTRPCAICIEDCDTESTIGSLVMTLPCKHKFHVDCIVPWLTERKAQCPLCNDDLLKRVDPSRDMQEEAPATAAGASDEA